MPKFPVNFRRKSVAEDLNNETIGEPSFRVLERPDATTNGKSFDGGAHMSRASTQPVAPRTAVSGIVQEENMFAGLKNNRGSGGSNTTKTASDNSSRHSNASTAPSSTDHHQSPQEHIKPGIRKSVTLEDPQSRNSGGFLRQAGRTFSFGSKKHSLPPIPAEPPVPALPESPAYSGRSRAPTTSTVTATTPPQVQTDFMLDLGGDLSSMLSNFDNRSSTTLKERNLTDKWAGQPSALHADHPTPVSPAHPWNSDNSNERLLGSDSAGSPLKTYPAAPPPVPRHNFSPVRDRVPEDDEDAGLLKDSLAASRFLGGSSNAFGISSSGGSSGSFRYGGNDEYAGSSRYGLRESYSSKPSRFDPQADEDNMFSHSLGRPARVAPRLGSRSKTEPNTKVMTPEQFEKYRIDKAKDNAANPDPDESDKEDEDNYDDDEDELEKSKQLARQRRQQESHMTSYRQQMMKVTGESSSHLGHKPQISASTSTPNLALNFEPEKSGIQTQSDGSDDEEIPLAILQAHGFPNKNRPPTRMNDSPSPSNLRVSMAPPTGPGPSDMASHAGGNLPPFARKLPQDPYLGAGLINQQPRESMALGVGSPSPHQRAAPTGGLVGVIANEERSRAMRRGSPGIDPNRNPSFNLPPNVGHNPAHNMSPQMMYPMGPQQMMPPPPMLTPGDQAQIHMTQQMNQFMQMQMQFMQMMAGGQGQVPGQEQGRLQGHMPAQSAGSLGDVRNSFLPHPGMGGRSSSMGMGLDMPQPDLHTRTMSMVQPSSASWIQPPHPGFAPSIRIQGDGYTPSIAPSERSNVGLPGRYRPVSSVPAPDQNGRTSTMSGALPSANSRPTSSSRRSPLANQDDEDEEKGWEEMKAKRDKKKSMWRSKKMLGSEIGALIT